MKCVRKSHLNLFHRNNGVGVGGASAKCIICTHWTLRTALRLDLIPDITIFEQYLCYFGLILTTPGFDITMYLFREIRLDTMSHIRSVVVKIANFQLSVSEADSRL